MTWRRGARRRIQGRPARRSMPRPCERPGRPRFTLECLPQTKDAPAGASRLRPPKSIAIPHVACAPVMGDVCGETRAEAPGAHPRRWKTRRAREATLSRRTRGRPALRCPGARRGGVGRRRRQVQVGAQGRAWAHLLSTHFPRSPCPAHLQAAARLWIAGHGAVDKCRARRRVDNATSDTLAFEPDRDS